MLYQSREIELDKGIFMVSIDLELAWGFNYELLKSSSIAEKYLRIIKERSRKNVKKLLELSEEFQIPFTWGIVGHLFLSSCTCGENGLAHPDMPRPALDVNKDWYSNDPCSNFFDEPLWYGIDIVKQILECKVEHEIACHSFSHIDFSKCSRKVTLAEIIECKKVMKDYGIKTKSFIFPKNRIGHLDILKQEGFKAFRYKIVSSYSVLPVNWFQEMIFPAVGEFVVRDNLLGVPSSLLFQSSHNLDALRREIVARRGINRAINEKKIFHMTMHDYLESDYLLNAFSKTLSYAVNMKNKGKLDIMTMYGCYERFYA